MSKKDIIVAFANRNKSNFEGKTPTEVHNIIRNHPGFKQVFEIWDAKDIVIFVFLLTTPVKDLNIAYDVISINLYGYQMIQLTEEDPSVDCEHCEGAGYYSCNECGGRGEEICFECEDGDIECDICDGDGRDEEGEECSDCDGRGFVRCQECDGRGYTDCTYCQDGDIDCSDCDGGMVTKYDSMKYEGIQIISYNPDVKNMIDDDFVKISEKLYQETPSKFYNLLIKDTEVVSDEFNEFKVGDTLLIQVVEHDALDLRKGRNYNIYCDEFNVF
jgi:hypothetical protein